MMGRQVGEAQLFYIFSVEQHVPADHLLRRVDAVLDLSFIRTSLADHYSRTGRPSIDPELMIRMLLIGYLYGIRSETRICEEVHLNLAYRWFCRLGLDGDLPERSTFSKNRHGRFREGDLFRRLFEEVVSCWVLERKHQTKGKLTRDAFDFDRKRNLFVCPAGRELTYRGARYAARVHTYRSKASDCAACPERQGCTSGRVRTVVRLFDEDARDHVRRLRDTPAYAQSCRERKKVEMLFAHLKRHLKLTRLRLRGLAGASEEFLLAATAQNLRKLVKLTARPTLAPSTA